MQGVLQILAFSDTVLVSPSQTALSSLIAQSSMWYLQCGRKGHGTLRIQSSMADYIVGVWSPPVERKRQSNMTDSVTLAAKQALASGG